MPEMEEMQDKLAYLKQYVKELGSVVVAFSGGVDSVFLLSLAHEVLGEKAIAVTAKLYSLPERERIEAETFCKERAIAHIVCPFDELSVEGFRENSENRCYFCKKALFQRIQEIARGNGIQNVIEGSNVDDLSDYRPGLQAISELGIKSPLREAGLTKQEIRILSKEMGLPTWRKPSFACLASRFPYGELITRERLLMVEQAEQFLMEQGFRQVRVRIHGQTARIEVLSQDFGHLLEIRDEVIAFLKECGFVYVTMDLQGYRTGSMNEGMNLL